MNLDLVRERTNILDIKKLDNGMYAVMYEFQYNNKDGSKVWQKEVYLCDFTNILSGEYQKMILNEVKIARAELEK